ncbi:unnamed protein product, partial [Aureobasidium pullulans]
MSWMDRERFLEGFTYEVEKDFDVNSTPSSWADAELSLAHRYWGDEDHRIELPHPDDHTCRLSTSALTPDKKFIAASNGFVVNLYDVATKECHMDLSLSPLHSLPIKHLLHDTDLLTSWTHVVAAFPTTHPSGILLRERWICSLHIRTIMSCRKHRVRTSRSSISDAWLKFAYLAQPGMHNTTAYWVRWHYKCEGMLRWIVAGSLSIKIPRRGSETSYNVKCPAILPRDLPEAKTRLPTLAMTVFDLAYITTKVFTIHKLNGDRSLIIAVTPLPWLFWYSRRKALGNITSSSLSS